jgi:hypothetical protein
MGNGSTSESQHTARTSHCQWAAATHASAVRLAQRRTASSTDLVIVPHQRQWARGESQRDSTHEGEQTQLDTTHLGSVPLSTSEHQHHPLPRAAERDDTLRTPSQRTQRLKLARRKHRQATPRISAHRALLQPPPSQHSVCRQNKHTRHTGTFFIQRLETSSYRICNRAAATATNSIVIAATATTCAKQRANHRRSHVEQRNPRLR